MIRFCSKDVGRCIYFVFTYQEFISPVVRNSELESIFSETVLLDWSHSSISFYFWSFAVLFLYLKHLYRQPVTPRWALNLSGKTRICQNSQSSLQGELVEQKRSWGILSKWSMTEYKTKKMWYFFLLLLVTEEFRLRNILCFENSLVTGRSVTVWFYVPLCVLVFFLPRRDAMLSQQKCIWGFLIGRLWLRHNCDSTDRCSLKTQDSMF